MNKKWRNAECGMRNWDTLRTSAAQRADSIDSKFQISHSKLSKSAFTLFEVLIALGVFAMAVTGLAVALDSAVGAAVEARERALARVVLESRLAAAMSDPPTNGKRVVEARDNHGIRVEESLDPFEAKTTNGTLITGLWKLKISADFGSARNGRESAEILIYKP